MEFLRKLHDEVAILLIISVIRESTSIFSLILASDLGLPIFLLSLFPQTVGHLYSHCLTSAACGIRHCSLLYNGRFIYLPPPNCLCFPESHVVQHKPSFAHITSTSLPVTATPIFYYTAASLDISSHSAASASSRRPLHHNTPLPRPLVQALPLKRLGGGTAGRFSPIPAYFFSALKILWTL